MTAKVKAVNSFFRAAIKPEVDRLKEDIVLSDRQEEIFNRYYIRRQDVNRGFDNQNLQAQTRDILGAVTGGTAQTIAASTANAANAINAIKDGNAALIREFGNVETALTALSGKQQECCCGILRAVDSVNYNGAINTAAINANTTAQTQKILDALAQSKIDSLQAKVQTLELAQAMAGVVKYPQAMTYGAGPSPFCGCGYGYAV